MPIPKIVTQYEYDKFEKPGVDFNTSDKNSKSKTIQSDMDAADINKIMARFEKTGVIIDPSGVERQPQYGDFSQIGNFHEMQIQVARAKEVFAALPASTRNFFKNDPQQLVDFISNPANDDKSIELGLMPKKAPKAPTQAEKDADEAALKAKKDAAVSAASGA